MKTVIAPFAALSLIAGAQFYDQPEQSMPDVSDYAFNPSSYTQLLCGPSGIKRASFFKSSVGSLLVRRASAADADDGNVPLLEGLDIRDFPISSSNTQAKAYFRQGFSMLYGFNHFEAIRAFKVAQAADPDCAICYWGEAIALGPNINAPMTDDAAPMALAAMQKAASLIENADAREQALIRAGVARYSADAAKSRAELDTEYAAAMANVHAAYPDDQDIATLYAEALMDTSPWDYWERDFVTPRPHIQTALDAINGVLAVNPDHYGAIHLHIHLYEASVGVQTSEVHADRLAKLPLASGHLIHMPSHIYFRIGRYLDSLDINKRAADIDADYLAQTQGSMLYRYGYYPHNVHFVLTSAQMAQDKLTALEYAETLDRLLPMEYANQAPWIPPIKAAPYFAYADFASVEGVEALPDPGDAIPYIKAIWHYARGKVFAEAGDDRAWMEQEAIEQLAKTDAIQNAPIPAAAILEIASNTIAAKRLMAAGNFDGAIELMEKSVALQDTLSYLEPPFWYYSTEQTLGAALYGAGEYQKAEQAFKASLIRHPNSAASLYGLWQTQSKLGLEAEADFTKALFEKATRSAPTLSMATL